MCSKLYFKKQDIMKSTNLNLLSRALSVVLLFLGLALTGCYDDGAVWKQLIDLELRVKELERLCSQTNTNIEALQTIVSALQDKDYVTGVAPIKEGDKVLGYTITFSESGAVTIYHGKDGQNGNDGRVPSLGVKQDGDEWYWTVDGQWLTDADGNKVRASAKDGQDGKPGVDGKPGNDVKPGNDGAAGVTPTLKIEEGYWYVSYDGGKTWEPESLGQAGDRGDSMFKKVSYDDNYVYITMADGQQLTLPRTSASQNEGSVGPAIIALEKTTATTATFTGHLDVPASELPFSQVMVYYSDAETFNINDADKVYTTTFDTDQNFSLTLNNLKYDTKYSYCVYVKVKSEEYYSEVKTFTTPMLSVETATDLSSFASANCYIVSCGGLYKFKTVKGNSSESVGNVALTEVLWETFGTSEAPECRDLIDAFCYRDGYIAFQTADTFKEGNAVIAAKDANGKILWSWHIWLTDQPKEQVYYNNAGTMMDRNLGATSATPGDVSALGLLYQWGRKDPFLGSSSISSSTLAKSTIAWPSYVSSNSTRGKIEYAIENPTTFISSNSYNSDWYYTGSESTDNTRWTTSESPKSIYDPCPAGWRVPDGGSNRVWSKASGSSSYFSGYPYDSTNDGMNFSGKFGSDQTIWYPASGHSNSDGSLGDVGSYGMYWSASPYSSLRAYYLEFGYNGNVHPSCYGSSRARGQSVRCLQE